MTTARADLRPTPPPGPAGLSDHDLVERVRAGDAAAFELIMRRHNRRLFRLARSVLRNGAEAEDVVQETYVRAFARLDEFRGPDGFAAWLARIAYNEALGRVRVQDRVVSLHDYVSGGDGDADVRHVDAMTSPHPDPERLTGQDELRRLLEGAIDALSDDFRAVFVLRAVEGMSVAETAEALSIPPETVKTRFHRARHRLQEHLGARFEALVPSAFEFGGARCDRIVEAVLARIGPALEARRQDAARSETVAARWPKPPGDP
ncbi:MAG TPA: RNA polymerase sigma factor [Geminicoccaceae bacterium]|nr:RNA polymerase sigma factor [Geminicoccaceae bacterium]